MVEIVIRGEVEKDFPSLRFVAKLKGLGPDPAKEFLKEMEREVRRRLELRPGDKVTFELIRPGKTWFRWSK